MWNHYTNMSERATQSIKEGMMTAAIIEKRFKSKGIMRGVTKKDIDSVVPSCEWHHVGESFKEVNFFLMEHVFECRKQLREEVKKRSAVSNLKRKIKKAGFNFAPLKDGSKWMELKDVSYYHVASGCFDWV